MKNSKQPLRNAKSTRRNRPKVDPRVEKRLAAQVQNNLNRAVIKDELDSLFDLIRNESKGSLISERWSK